MNNVIKEKIRYIYGNANTDGIAKKLEDLLQKWEESIAVPQAAEKSQLPLTEKDAIIITYGDTINKDGEKPLRTLNQFAKTFFKGTVSGLHILPFSPYSSDDGFSVIDYRAINPDLGTWQDMELITENFSLMADLVLNHCSQESEWFKSFLDGDPKYSKYFITVQKGTDLSEVFRPRALPLLHGFQTSEGEKQVWTTFSRDQVDLNFANPEVFLEFTDILLFYISKGINIIRLDAIGFLWKEIGTSCMHHPKTHAMVQLYRSILKEVAPHAVLLTETNVPHKENISYFGDGENEAQMVYQFTLPPLTLDAMVRGDASHLTDWALSLDKPDPNHTFFNFLASHDGIGVLPAHGYLSEKELSNLAQTVLDRGGKISYKSTPKGDIPYELNINYCDAVAENELSTEYRARKFLTSQAIMLSMAGVPGIYIHSILGSKNWTEGVEITGMNRTINREKLNYTDLVSELDDSGSFRFAVFNGYKKLLGLRRSLKSFHPAADQSILKLDEKVFAVVRGKDEPVLCLHNVSAESVTLDSAAFDRDFNKNLLQVGKPFSGNLAPYETAWVQKD